MLLVSAVTIVGDLVTAVFYFLQGEVTGRFFLKSLTIFVVAGIIFGFYFLERKKIQYRKNVPRKTFRQAASQILIADVSMSLDNVLAVAGAARDHPYVLIFGLVLSIALMGVAASLIARILQKYRWIAYVGLAIIFYVAVDMIWRGATEIKPAVGAIITMLL